MPTETKALPQVSDLKQCPKCGGTRGTYTGVSGKRTEHFDWHGKRTRATPFQLTQGGVQYFCLDCDQRIARHDFPRRGKRFALTD